MQNKSIALPNSGALTRKSSIVFRKNQDPPSSPVYEWTASFSSPSGEKITLVLEQFKTGGMGKLGIHSTHGTFWLTRPLLGKIYSYFSNRDVVKSGEIDPFMSVVFGKIPEFTGFESKYPTFLEFVSEIVGKSVLDPKDSSISEQERKSFRSCIRDNLRKLKKHRKEMTKKPRKIYLPFLSKKKEVVKRRKTPKKLR